MRKPFRDANLYVCGSAWSTGQGWVYGALTQAELMLEEHFGLSRPKWLPPERLPRPVSHPAGSAAQILCNEDPGQSERQGLV